MSVGSSAGEPLTQVGSGYKRAVTALVPSCAVTALLAVTSTTDFWPAHVFHVQAAEHRFFRAGTSYATAATTHPVPRLLFPIFNREEKALDAESNYNELFLASHRRFISHYFKVKRLALGRKNPSWRVTQKPVAEAGTSPGTAVSASYQPPPAQGCAAFWSWEKSPLWKITLVS